MQLRSQSRSTVQEQPPAAVKPPSRMPPRKTAAEVMASGTRSGKKAKNTAKKPPSGPSDPLGVAVAALSGARGELAPPSLGLKPSPHASGLRQHARK